MSFILWTLVWWTVCDMERWIGIAVIGPSAYMNWYTSEYTPGVIVFAYLLKVAMWLGFYIFFIK